MKERRNFYKIVARKSEGKEIVGRGRRYMEG
jgi:hypothetical protein